MRHGNDDIVDFFLGRKVDKVPKSVDEGIAPFKAESFGCGPFVLDEIGETFVSEESFVDFFFFGGV